MISYEGKSILVTGGTRGIGKALCESFESLGGKVWHTGRDKTSLRCFAVDLSDEEQTAEFLEFIRDMEFDVLVNNAGTNKIGPIEEYALEDYERIVQLNLTACFQTTQAAVRGMKERGYGRIVNVTSISSEISMPLRSAYCSSKFGLLGLTKATAVEMARHGILINAVGPGVTETELTRSVLGREKMDEIAERIPMGRLATVEDISNVVMFVASDMNTYMVGQNVIVDGGFTCI